ncbi:MAG: M50 family metallopeptidase [Thermomicrobiales bacterium]
MFLSVLLHEFGHAIVAQSRGVEVRSITLFIFGGVAGLARESDEAGDEFWIAIAGPIVSISLAGIFGFRVAQSSPASTSRRRAAWISCPPINLILVLFNMIPGFPLDGGWVLRRPSGGQPTTCARRRGSYPASASRSGRCSSPGGLLLIVADLPGERYLGRRDRLVLATLPQQGRNAVEQTHAPRYLTRDLMHTAPVTISPMTLKRWPRTSCWPGTRGEYRLSMARRSSVSRP